MCATGSRSNTNSRNETLTVFHRLLSEKNKVLIVFERAQSGLVERMNGDNLESRYFMTCFRRSRSERPHGWRWKICFETYVVNAVW